MRNRIIDIELQAVHLAKQYTSSGPLLKFLCTIDKFRLSKPVIPQSHFLVMQGSFDPPTLAHMEILKRSIDFMKKKYDLESITVIILLSLEHIEKKIDLLKRSLLGHRIIMLEKLFQAEDIGSRVILGLSNVPLYIELNKAIANTVSTKCQTITYITGIDVFKKVFDSKYYSLNLERVFELIFNSNFIVPSREEILSKDRFLDFLKLSMGNELEKYQDKIHFLSLPKKYLKISSSHIRQSFQAEKQVTETELHPIIRTFLHDTHLYHPKMNELAQRITIQSIVRFSNDEISNEIIIAILERLLGELEENLELSQRVVEEYKSQESKEVYKKWKEYLTLVSQER